jgi:hypothetical protein|uniref:Uncharacterized protein n=1 Tax=Ostreococcus mediterraneus TaxID=1486918 RepID=A0A7S0Z695_9CHLO|mmetsp:Transcript_510/g.985  ORF Transcript_510/g.985 Transcript_510/m.985 type:complete len:675 (+) Transcript_510:177-2201(+)|eukprot:CAMPEP_0179616390 /NCGR_PEP_ID=MMETSP0930-20121108/6601_1 /TAXON_ID=548131 ORGANISM="Ostreococcus mediterraneus, Strain clade-D-RCC1621" /NCGR_SAMPLE_ID=MMETSP0930 /ASSEMBLY_ACC=CAM_ASM_000580 /LENGTH=674 /DNA_ID=CAMNT_0021485227 /DNA_START=253 /DNA_END=2277 /DNA_ORIENTATION=-
MSTSTSAASEEGPRTPIVGVKGTREERGGASTGESPEEVKRRMEAEGRIYVSEPARAIMMSGLETDGAGDADEAWIAFEDEDAPILEIVDAIEIQNEIDVDEDPPVVGADDEEDKFELGGDAPTTIDDVDDAPVRDDAQDAPTTTTTKATKAKTATTTEKKKERKKRIIEPVKPHEEIYGPIDQEALARAAERCKTELADGGVFEGSHTRRKRKYEALVNALCALVTAFGCLFTYPSLPDNFCFTKPIAFIMGHFMTTGIGVDRSNLKKTHWLQTSTGVIVDACISRCWNVWKRSLDVEFWDHAVGVWNVIPYEAHGSADGDAYAQKGAPLVTREMRAFAEEFALIDSMVEAILRTLRFQALVTMGGAARVWVERRRVSLQKLVVHDGAVCTLAAHACYLLDRAFLARSQDKSEASVAKRVAASAYHFANFGYAVGVLLNDQARGEAAGRAFLARQEAKYGVKIAGEFVRFTPEQQRQRQLELRRQWLKTRVLSHFGRWTYFRMYKELNSFRDFLIIPESFAKWAVRRAKHEKRVITRMMIDTHHWARWSNRRAANEPLTFSRFLGRSDHWALWKDHRRAIESRWVRRRCGDGLHWAKWTKRRNKKDHEWLMIRMGRNDEHWAKWTKKRATRDTQWTRERLPSADHWCKWTQYRAKYRRDRFMAKLNQLARRAR